MRLATIGAMTCRKFSILFNCINLTEVFKNALFVH